jgi:hypothetical protein
MDLICYSFHYSNTPLLLAPIEDEMTCHQFIS